MGLLGFMVALVVAASPSSDFEWETPSRIVVAAVSGGTPIRGFAKSGLFGAAASALITSTNLVPIALEEAACDQDCLRRCGGTTTCWSEAMEDVASGGPSIILVLDIRPSKDGRDQLSVRAFDRAARELVPQTVSREVDLAQSEDLADLLSVVVAEVVRSPRWLARHGERYGTLRVFGAQDGATIDIDDRSFGPTAGGLVTVRNVPPGPRQVRVARVEDAKRLFTQDAAVGGGRTLDVLVQFPDISTLPREIATWSGIALASAGTVVLVGAALAGEQSRAFRLCFVEPCPDADADGFVGFGDESDRAGLSGEGRRAGLRMVPLAIGLVVGGAAVALGARLETSDEPDAVPLWSTIGGVALGALMSGLTSAL